MLRPLCQNLYLSTLKNRQSLVALQQSLHTTNRMSDKTYEDPATIKFLEDVHKIMVDDALVKGTSREAPVVEFRHPEELKKLLQLPVKNEPATSAEILEDCKRVIKYSVKTGSVQFYNQLYSGIEPYSLAGSWITDALNTNIHTFEVAPVFVLLEQYCVQKICSLIGYENGDGVFGSGGSFCNLMATHLARYKRYPNMKSEGMYNQPILDLYTSDQAHYSLLKAGGYLGFGTDNIIRIKTDDGGRMLIDDLEVKVEESKKKGHIPFFVMGSCGTTVLGSYDSLNEIADACSKHNMWFHIDAAWGGGVLLSSKHKHLMDGVERADSVAWNLHKMVGANIQCSGIFVKEKGLLEKANRAYAEYLFQPDKFYDVSYDIGDKTVQCGRKADVLKLWLLWKGKGDSGLSERIEKAFDNSQYLATKLRKTDGFKLVIPEFQCTNICFWYIPPSLRGQEETPEWWAKIAKVSPIIKQRMIEDGSMMIGFCPLSMKGHVNFFRIIVVNPACEYSDMDKVLTEIERLGNDL
ncbi:cysteine sulfinic acid decarboxylase [Patella vulgata]|uniref:cysteine sulfinic acid decarboxylase n=1 Tax=Patella vulgata TaxID=6465 RepID=UPI00217F88E4|nr:cysteine sulfinic acid decarboxylase [Patella vulgata]XP_055957210.1 cysteine sulfinic acid decarboxylase [Patella vulgata]